MLSSFGTASPGQCADYATKETRCALSHCCSLFNKYGGIHCSVALYLTKSWILEKTVQRIIEVFSNGPNRKTATPQRNGATALLLLSLPPNLYSVNIYPLGHQSTRENLVVAGDTNIMAEPVACILHVRTSVERASKLLDIVYSVS